ncbi:MAG: serine/threonine-protein kinase [Gemmatimonadaceae bacterium]|nr:serine/threonine-protein kinase [Gemmatimonadaceae bacterium]
MDKEHWQKLQPLMDEALALSIDDRQPWLERIRQEAPTIADELEALLEREGTLDRRGFLDGPLTQGRELVAALTADVPAERLARLSAALADRYEVGERVGRGGMAEVFSARDVRHERRVAIKIIRPDTSSALGATRFLSEIRFTASLTHPHILPLLDSGEADGVLYYVMPFIEGESLRARMRREGAMSIADVVRIVRAVGEALAHAHAKGTVHRDIKPDNVLLAGRQAWVADFGIAKALSSSATPQQTGTGLGVALGSPGYMAPEQIEGAENVDARADLYSLGVVMWEMLTGKPMFEGNTLQQLLLQHVAVDAPRVDAARADVPRDLADIVERLVAKSPDARFPSATEFLNALESVDRGTGARPAMQRPTATSRVVWAAGIASVAIGGWWFATRDVTPTALAPEPLTQSGDVLIAMLSPDAKRFVFRRRINPVPLWIRNVADSGEGRILAPRVPPGAFTWVDDSLIGVMLRDTVHLVHATTGAVVLPEWGRGLRATSAGTGAMYARVGAPVGPSRLTLRHITATGFADSVFVTLDSGEVLSNLIRHPARTDLVAITRSADSTYRVQQIAQDKPQRVLRVVPPRDTTGLHLALAAPGASPFVNAEGDALFVRLAIDSIARVDLGDTMGDTRRFALTNGILSNPARDGSVLLRSTEITGRTWRFPVTEDATKRGTVIDEVGGSASFTAVSPDGKFIAQTERVGGRPTNIVVRSLETGVTRRVLTGSRMVTLMLWSPDGTKIAIRTATPTQSQRLAVLDVRDGRLVTLGRPPIKPAAPINDLGFPPAWSADGKTLFAQDFAHRYTDEDSAQFTGVIPDAIVRRYTLVEGDTGVAIHDYLVSRHRNLPRGGVDTLWINGLLMSPDGKQLLVGGDGMTVIPLDGSAPRRVVEPDSTVTWMYPIAWQNDGRIAYATRSSAVGISGLVFRTFSVSVNGGASRPFGTIPSGCSTTPTMLENRVEAVCFENSMRANVHMLRGLR